MQMSSWLLAFSFGSFLAKTEAPTKHMVTVMTEVSVMKTRNIGMDSMAWPVTKEKMSDPALEAILKRATTGPVTVIFVSSHRSPVA